MKKRIRLIALTLTATILIWAWGTRITLHAQTERETAAFEAANELYESGHFEEATTAYRQLVDAGFRHESLFYNLGNGYFKQGDIGRAILFYQRAARLNPRDADIQANLDLAREQTRDKFEVEEDAVERLVALARSWLTLNEMAVVTLGLWFAFGALILAYRHSRAGHWREGLLYALILVTLLLAGGLFSLGSRLYFENQRPQSVILAGEVDVMSGPGDQYITEFTLHSGAEVSRIENRGQWARIALPGEQFQGWVPLRAIALIDS